MENTCYLVCSRGILKLCDFYSKSPKSSCDNDHNYLREMLNNMFDGMTIYVCSDLLLFFFKNIFPKINKKFTLVTGDSDLCVPHEILSAEETNNLINSPYLIKWFAQNTTIQNHSKIYQLPIGLDYHTISNNPNHKWKLPKEGYLPVDQEKILFSIFKNSKPFFLRIPKIYVNFTKGNDRFGDRKKSLATIPKNLLVINDKFVPRTVNWINIKNFTFVLSPFGNGMDCHRTWEALCLGSIPVIRGNMFKELFKDLPVLIVNDWYEINQDLLINTVKSFKNTKFNYEKLNLEYWINKIKN
jgi:hypothetical protein